MRIKLSKYSSFEPTKESVKSYFFGLVITIVGLLIHMNITWFLISLFLITLFFIWFETTYYPYGVKYDENVTTFIDAE